MNATESPGQVLDRLFATIESRRHADPNVSKIGRAHV